MITERDIQAKDIKRLLLAVYRNYSTGSITESKAQKETYLLNSILRAIEITDLENRLENLENILKER